MASALSGLFDVLPDIPSPGQDRRETSLLLGKRPFLLNYGLNHLSDVLGRTGDNFSPSHLAAQFRAGDEAVLRGTPLLERLKLAGRFLFIARWHFTSKPPVLNASGRVVGTVGITRNLSPSSRAAW